MIEWLEIDNFHGISHLNYTPKQINVIIGRNNSGKTSLLNAISAVQTGMFAMSDSYSGMMFHKDNESLLRKFGVKLGAEKATLSSNTHTVSLYKIGAEIPYDIRMAYTARLHYAMEKIWETSKLPQGLFDAVKTYIQTKLPISISTFDDTVLFYIDLETILRKDNGLVTELVKLFTDNLEGSSQLSSYLIVDTLLQQLNPAMNKDVLPNAETVVKILNSESVVSKRFTDDLRLIKLESILKEYEVIPNLERLTADGVVYRDQNGALSMLPYDMHGDGFFSLLRLLYCIQDAKDGVLLIEEPENHMHPGYLAIFIEHLIEFAQKLNVQIFITTHSSDVISEFAHYPENEEEDQLIQISNIVQRNGNTELYNKSTSAARKTLDELLIDLRGA